MRSTLLMGLVLAAIGVGGLAGALVVSRTPATLPAAADPKVAQALTALTSELDGVKLRLASLEQRPSPVERTESPAPRREDPDAAKPADSATPADAAAQKQAELAAAAKELAPKFKQLALDGVPQKDLHQLLDDIVKKGQGDAAIAAIQSLIEKDPNDSKSHYLLAESYYSKLMNDGSIAGYQTIGPLTLGEWEKASELDPKFWEPSFEHAVYLTYVPESLGMTPQVISEFEQLIERQNGSSSNSQYARSYSHLSRMYLRVGKKEKALQTLRDGAALFPSDAELKKQLDLLQRE